MIDVIGQRTARARARRQQWKLVSGTMTIHFVLQVISFALIAHVFRTDERFETKGSHLGMSFPFPSSEEYQKLIRQINHSLSES